MVAVLTMGHRFLLSERTNGQAAGRQACLGRLAGSPLSWPMNCGVCIVYQVHPAVARWMY